MTIFALQTGIRVVRCLMKIFATFASKVFEEFMIKNIVFDLGGVIFKIDKAQAIRRFNEVGFNDAASYLDAFTQIGIFGDLESGRITAEQFRCQLSELAGKELTLDELQGKLLADNLHSSLIIRCEFKLQNYYS